MAREQFNGIAISTTGGSSASWAYRSPSRTFCATSSPSTSRVGMDLLDSRLKRYLKEVLDNALWESLNLQYAKLGGDVGLVGAVRHYQLMTPPAARPHPEWGYWKAWHTRKSEPELRPDAATWDWWVRSGTISS